MIHEHISTRGAGFVRAWIFSLWAVYLIGNDPAGFLRLPGLEFEAHGILALLPDWFFDALITPAGLNLLKWLTLAGVVACAFGVRPWRAIALPTVVLLTLHQGVHRGLFEYVNHKELSALYATYVLAAFPATGFTMFASRPVREPSERDDATTRLMMLGLMAALLIPYCFIGLHRLAQNDFSLWSSDTFAHYVTNNSYKTTWFENTDMAEALLTRRYLLQAAAIAFPIGTALEVLAPLCIVHRRFRYLWIVSLAGLHVVTWAVLDILFWENLALFPVLLLDRDYVLTRFDVLRQRVLPRATTHETAPSVAEVHATSS